MKIPSDLKYIRKVSTVVENFLKSNNIDDPSLIFDIRLCVEEAVKNAIIHGNKKRRGFPVFISYSLRGARFSIEIEDRGEGFDPDHIPDPTVDENLYRGEGRGVFLIRKFMDKVVYNDRGNKIFMTKYVRTDMGGDDAN